MTRMTLGRSAPIVMLEVVRSAMRLPYSFRVSGRAYGSPLQDEGHAATAEAAHVEALGPAKHQIST
ncbi:hypothetical protein GCM10017673_02580 [Streptosporangium violaceochromogenes]|nr:hypothetical protein GCM10017673_02580 [Streptosporangium violaceochromogenes]